MTFELLGGPCWPFKKEGLVSGLFWLKNSATQVSEIYRKHGMAKKSAAQVPSVQSMSTDFQLSHKQIVRLIREYMEPFDQKITSEAGHFALVLAFVVGGPDDQSFWFVVQGVSRSWAKVKVLSELEKG